MNVCKCIRRTLLSLLVALLILPALALSDSAGRSQVERPLIQEPGPPPQPLMADPGDYTGMVRFYVVEKVSRWRDDQNKNFHNVFLEMPLDSVVAIADGTRHYRRYTWTPNIGSLSEGNVAVAATIVDDDWFVGYSDPPAGASFYGFQADAAAFASAGETDSNKTSPGFTHTAFAEKGSTTW